MNTEKTVEKMCTLPFTILFVVAVAVAPLVFTLNWVEGLSVTVADSLES